MVRPPANIMPPLPNRRGLKKHKGQYTTGKRIRQGSVAWPEAKQNYRYYLEADCFLIGAHISSVSLFSQS